MIFRRGRSLLNGLISIQALSLVGLVALLIFHTQSVFGQSNGLGITPRLSYTLNAGTQKNDTLYINNLSKTQPLTLKVKVVDFKATDESGTATLLEGSDTPQTPWSLKPYITVPDIVTLQPGQSQFVPFSIKLPANTGAGSYYSAVEYTAVNNTTQQQVNVAASGATLLFVNVPGNATEILRLLQFAAYQNNGFKSTFSKPPSTFAFRVKNDGNLNESPAGSLAVKNIFGHVVAHIDNANPTDNLVLMGQTRRFEVCNPKSTSQENLGRQANCVPLKIAPGRYTAQIVLLYGQNGQASRQISASAVFWYLPLWFVIIIAGIILAVIIGIWWIQNKIRGSRRPHRRHR